MKNDVASASARATAPRTAPKPASGRRDIAIDSLRGVAIILMVSGHVIGDTAASGMRVADDSAWRDFYLLLEDMRMPLFTALSGFVYALRPVRALDRYPRLVTGKVRRLLVPLATVGIVFLVVQAITPGTNASTSITDVWKLFAYGTGHFWFLQSIFTIFLVVGIADALGCFTRARNLLLATIGTALISIVVTVPDPWAVFSINGTIRILPFFLLGYLFSFYIGRAAYRALPTLALTLATAVLFVGRAVSVLTPIEYPHMLDKTLGVCLGLAAISLLLSIREHIAWAPLARLGYFSFAIYLLHVFGTALARIVLGQLGVESEIIIFSACLIMGLALPTIFEMTAGRINWVSRAFLGQKAYSPSALAPLRGRKAA